MTTLLVPGTEAWNARYNPPELAQAAQRGDKPVSEWPGRVVNKGDIMAAHGDPRDWFHYGHRLMAAEQAWGEFADARARRRDMTAGFEWNQILILGDYGSGKTTLGTKLARFLFGLGHPVFSNASCLFGWRLPYEELYTALGSAPLGSVLLVDESSAALSSRVQHGVAVTAWQEQSLNVRKRLAVCVYMSAQDYYVASSVRRECKEVWLPISSKDLKVEQTRRRVGGSEHVLPLNNPDNFRHAWHVWDNFPFKKANLIEGKVDTDGFGPPSYTMYDDGEHVRRAMLLNDTFEPAAAGMATVADRDIVKDLLRAQLGIAVKEGRNVSANDAEDVTKLIGYFQALVSSPPEYFRPTEMAGTLDMNPKRVGQVMSDYFDTPMIPGVGYHALSVYASMRKKIAEQEAGEE